MLLFSLCLSFHLPRLLNSFSNALVGKEAQETPTFYGDFWGDFFITPPSPYG
jgi:hypothetical protein